MRARSVDDEGDVLLRPRRRYLVGVAVSLSEQRRDAEQSGSLWTEHRDDRSQTMQLVRVEQGQALFVFARDRNVWTRRVPAHRLRGDKTLRPGDFARECVERDVLAKVLAEAETITYAAVRDHASLDREGFNRHRAAQQIAARVMEKLRARYAELRKPPPVEGDVDDWRDILAVEASR